ncbi:MAG: phosphodiesterase [Synergistetes bacterium]|nr:MAG: Putative phosphodiesterase YfcE [bacterium 42_11]MBC7331824.1 phosphodiesterase [Synergistota bacterium]
MRVGVLSDTHGGLKAWEDSLKLFGGIDLILHAGDILYHGPRNPFPERHDPKALAQAINSLEVPFLVARGNCDADVDQLAIDFPILSPYVVYDLGGYRVFVHHGHAFSEEEVMKFASKLGVRLVVSGHTHRVNLERKNGIWFFNPGSPSLPKGEEGPTVGLIEGSVLKLLSLPDGKVLKEVNILA